MPKDGAMRLLRCWPLLQDKKTITIFLATLPLTYYDHFCHVGAAVANLVQLGERIEDDLKTDKLKNYQALFE